MSLKASEKKILKELTFSKDHKLRWSDLVEKTGLSKRTLSERLEDLGKRRLVYRYVDSTSREYPPPVYYGLTDGRFADLIWREYTTLYHKGLIDWGNLDTLFEQLFESIGIDILTTLYYISKAPSEFEAATLLAWHVSSYSLFMTEMGVKVRKMPELKQTIEKEWKEYKQTIKEWGEKLKSVFVSRFPEEFHEMAEAYFDFYLLERKNPEDNALQALQQIMKDPKERKRFESKVGKALNDKFLKDFMSEAAKVGVDKILPRIAIKPPKSK